MELMKTALMDETKVHYGIARAHQMMLAMKGYIESADSNGLNCLLSWKETRTQIEYDPILGKASASGNALDFVSFLVARAFVGKIYSHVGDLNLLGNFVSVHSLLLGGWAYSPLLSYWRG
jgi:hypothetical protein